MSRIYSDAIGIPEDGTWAARLACVVGLAYAGVGVVQVLVAFGFLGPFIGFSDLVGGFLLIIVDAVFLTGVKPLSKNDQEGYAFIAVGYILAAVLFALQIMVIITNLLGWLFQFEVWLLWNILNDITPSLWLFVMLVISTSALWIVGHFREKLLLSSKEESTE